MAADAVPDREADGKPGAQPDRKPDGEPDGEPGAASDAGAVVARLVRGWEALDADAIAACLAPDAVWHNMPFEPVRGRAAIADAIGRFLSGMRSAAFRIRHQAEIAPGIVLNEREDVFRRADGGTLSIPVMGCFEVRDGLVTAWRDYFDSGVMRP